VAVVDDSRSSGISGADEVNAPGISDPLGINKLPSQSGRYGS
jgi:hypothetical protein